VPVISEYATWIESLDSKVGCPCLKSAVCSSKPSVSRSTAQSAQMHPQHQRKAPNLYIDITNISGSARMHIRTWYHVHCRARFVGLRGVGVGRTPVKYAVYPWISTVIQG
jgi:hypothetical protein